MPESAVALFGRCCREIGAEVADLRDTKRSRLVAQQRKCVAATMRLAGASVAEVADLLHRDESTIALWDRTSDAEVADSAQRLAVKLGVVRDDTGALALAAIRQRNRASRGGNRA